jgi:hypothetical protein
MRSLSQARLLGGLHRAAPVPFRASCFTSGVHPPDATAQGLIACLDRRWDFPSISSSRLVAHEPNAFHYGVTIVGPVAEDPGWQAREGTGFDKSQFVVDWERQVVTCPAGKQSISWHPRAPGRDRMPPPGVLHPVGGPPAAGPDRSPPGDRASAQTWARPPLFSLPQAIHFSA